MYSYLSISDTSTFLYKDKGSKFIGYAFPCNSIDDIHNILEYVHQIHPKATHHCYAYRLGLNKTNFRTYDDGEPSNTAGKPILGQIDALQLSNVLVIIVRYYGGTKLGVGGLIEAYRTTALHTLSHAQIIEKSLFDTIQFTTDYTRQQDIYTIIRRYEGIIESTDLTEKNCVIIVKIPSKYNININSFVSEYPFLYTQVISRLM